MEAKMALRHSNLNPDRPDAGFLRTLDTSIKRNTAVIKKLKQINEEQRESIMDELRSVNLSKFVSEAVAAICDSKLRTSDLQAAVQICSLLHQRYMDFSPSLTQGLLKVFFPGKSSDDSDLDKNTKAMKKRCILKLLMELYFVGVIDDSGIFINIIRDIGNVDNLKDRDNTQLNLSLITSFCRQGRTFLGLDVSSETTNEELFKELNITLDQKKIIGKTVHVYHDAATELLLMEHSALRQLEIENEKILNVKGELSDENALSYEKIRKSYDHLYRGVSSLAEALEMKPPVLPEDSHTTRLRGGEESFSPTSGKDSSAVDSIWDDEDTRAFYESLPDLRAYVPAVLLGETDPKGTTEQSGSGKSHGQSTVEPISKDESSQTTTSQDVLDNPTETDTSQEGKHEDIVRGKEEREKEKTKHSEREKRKDKDMDRKGDNEREKLKFVDGSNLDDLLQRLPGCVSRELIDQLTVEFCYFNSKTNRKKLVRALSNVPRTSLELLPYYSRMVAILSTCMKDVSALLLQALEEEFNFLINKKDQMNIETKIRNIRFIGELCKFKVAPPGFVFSCLKACLDDFTHHSIDVACNLLDTCGRFLYRCPETTIRMSNMLDILMRLKNVKNLDPHHNTLVENVYYLCKPPERPTRMSKALSPMNQYIKKLLFSDLDKTSIESVLRQLRKLPWSECEGFILKCFMKVHKGKYNHIHLFASLTAALSHYHDDFSVYVVDEVLEVIRSELELNNYGKQQRRLAYMRFLGELYSYEQLDSSVIFDTLYLVLFFGHGTSEQDTLDPLEDCFRIRMVITLLGTCGHYFDRGSSKRKLDRLLLHFQRYILNKGPLPLDVEFDLQDLLADLRPNMVRYRSVEEAVTAITELDEQERDTAEKPRQHSKRGENGGENGERSSTGELGVGAESESESDSCMVGLHEEELEESNNGESDEVEESNQGSDHDDEDKVCVKQMLGEVDPLEKADFEKDLHALIQESLESRKLELRSRGTVNMSIPMNIFEGKEGQWGEIGEDEDGEGVEVKVLVRKGNKQHTKDMNIPRNSSLVHSTKHKGAAQLDQMQDIKRLVLEYNEREEESNGLHSSSSSSWLPPWNAASSTWENDSSKTCASRHRHHYFAAALGSHYTRKK